MGMALNKNCARTRCREQSEQSLQSSHTTTLWGHTGSPPLPPSAVTATTGVIPTLWLKSDTMNHLPLINSSLLQYIFNVGHSHKGTPVGVIPGPQLTWGKNTRNNKILQVRAILYNFILNAMLIGMQSPRLNTVQWPGAEQRGHLQAFSSQWRSTSTASGLDLLRKTEPQNILEGL